MNNLTEKLTMKPSFNNILKACVLLWALASVPIGSADSADEEDHAAEAHGTEKSALQLSLKEREQAGMAIAVVEQQVLNETLRVPGEVVINAYRSAHVTPRMQAQVMARHVRLGDQVEPGQPLVTLSSVALSDAEGELILADREWRRVQSLGKQAVGAARYSEAQVARQQAMARVLAYGMQETQANQLLQSEAAASATGEVDLLAPLGGTVLFDDFIIGELIEPGRILFEISDESLLWVEANVPPGALSSVEVGAPARVSVDGLDWTNGEVIQLHHRLNETTRTQVIRIAVENRNDQLHPGQFVEAEIVSGKSEPRLAVPKQALTLINGVSTVFKWNANEGFTPNAVNIGPEIGDWVVVADGLQDGDEIAVSGVFHLKSLLLKSSIGDEH